MGMASSVYPPVEFLRTLRRRSRTFGAANAGRRDGCLWGGVSAGAPHVVIRRPQLYENLVALTGIERAKRQFRRVRFVLSLCKHVHLVRRRPRRRRYGLLAWSPGGLPVVEIEAGLAMPCGRIFVRALLVGSTIETHPHCHRRRVPARRDAPCGGGNRPDGNAPVVH